MTYTFTWGTQPTRLKTGEVDPCIWLDSVLCDYGDRHAQYVRDDSNANGMNANNRGQGRDEAGKLLNERYGCRGRIGLNLYLGHGLYEGHGEVRIPDKKFKLDAAIDGRLGRSVVWGKNSNLIARENEATKDETLEYNVLEVALETGLVIFRGREYIHVVQKRIATPSCHAELGIWRHPDGYWIYPLKLLQPMPMPAFV
jgi:hypothetical protein